MHRPAHQLEGHVELLAHLRERLVQREAGPQVAAAAALLVVHGTAASAYAQRLQEALPDDKDKWIRWGIAAGVIVIIALPAFLNPKRSHLT